MKTQRTKPLGHTKALKETSNICMPTTRKSELGKNDLMMQLKICKNKKKSPNPGDA